MNDHECPILWNKHTFDMGYRMSEQANGKKCGLATVTALFLSGLGHVFSDAEECLYWSPHRTEVWYQDIAYSVWSVQYIMNTLKQWRSQNWLSLEMTHNPNWRSARSVKQPIGFQQFGEDLKAKCRQPSALCMAWVVIVPGRQPLRVSNKDHRDPSMMLVTSYQYDPI